jgi:hypothetical protein
MVGPLPDADGIMSVGTSLDSVVVWGRPVNPDRKSQSNGSPRVADLSVDVEGCVGSSRVEGHVDVVELAECVEP